MNGVDFNKALAKEKEYFQDTIQKDRAQTKKQVENEQARHERIQKDTQDVYLKDKSNSERSYQKNLSEMSNRTNQALEEKNDSYKKKLNDERMKFNETSLAQRRDFDSRLRDIKGSYNQAFDSERERNKNVLEATDKRYDQNIKDTQQKTEAQIGEFMDRTRSAGGSLRDDFKREKEAMVRAHDDQLMKTHQDEIVKRTELKNKMSKDIARVKEVAQEDHRQMMNYTSNKINDYHKNFNERNRQLNDDYTAKYDNYIETKRKEDIKTNEEHQNDVTELNRKHNKDIRNIELDLKRTDNGDGYYAEVVRRQQGQKDHDLYDTKIQELRDQVVTAQRDYQKRSDMDQDEFNQTFSKERVDALTRSEKDLKRLSADNMVKIADEREKSEKILNNMQHKNLVERDAYEKQMMAVKKESKQKIDNLKASFNKSLNNVENKSNIAIKSFQKQNDEDKDVFIKQTNQQRNKENYELRRQFAKQMDGTINEYEQRINTLNQENTALKQALEEKIANIMVDKDHQIKSMQKQYEEKREADYKASQIMIDHKESELKKTINQLTAIFNRKMDIQQNNNDRLLKQVTNEYENKLKNLVNTQVKELNERALVHQTQEERLKKSYENDRERLVQQYENQIHQMKMNSEQQIERLKEYNQIQSDKQPG